MLLVVLLAGCQTVSSPHEFASGWVGSHFERMLEAVDRSHDRDLKNKPSREDVMKTRYSLANDNTVYPIPIVFGRCKVHWEVNSVGIIVGYHYEDVIKNGCNW
jgi:hypothetical protein